MSDPVMIPTPADVLSETADFVGKAAGEVAKLAAFQSTLEDRGKSVVDLLVDRQLLAPESKERKLAQYRDDPSAVLNDLAVVIAHVNDPQMGGPSGTKSASAGDPDKPETADEAYERILREGANV